MFSGISSGADPPVQKVVSDQPSMSKVFMAKSASSDHASCAAKVICSTSFLDLLVTAMTRKT
jgi:hypothetical protein